MTPSPLSDVVTGIKYYEAAARCGSGQSSLQLGLACVTPNFETGFVC